MANERIVQIQENPKYNGYKGTLQEKYPIIVNNEVASTTDEGGDFMSNETELLKQQIKNLEQQFDVKLNSRDQIIDAKIENLSLKLDGQHTLMVNKIDAMTTNINQSFELATDKKIADLKASLSAEAKENRNFTWVVMGVAVAAATLIAAVIPLIQNFISK